MDTIMKSFEETIRALNEEFNKQFSFTQPCEEDGWKLVESEDKEEDGFKYSRKLWEKTSDPLDAKNIEKFDEDLKDWPRIPENQHKLDDYINNCLELRKRLLDIDPSIFSGWTQGKSLLGDYKNQMHDLGVNLKAYKISYLCSELQTLASRIDTYFDINQETIIDLYRLKEKMESYHDEDISKLIREDLNTYLNRLYNYCKDIWNEFYKIEDTEDIRYNLLCYMTEIFDSAITALMNLIHDLIEECPQFDWRND